jgi:cation transport regulator ChaC
VLSKLYLFDSTKIAVVVVVASMTVLIDAMSSSIHTHTNTRTIFGYGSLMNQQSTINTMPSARNSRKAILADYVRVFSLVSISGIRTKTSNLETKEMAALAIRPKTGSQVYGCVFDIPEDEFAHYLEREHRYKAIEVEVTAFLQDDPTTTHMQSCWTVIEQSNAEYMAKLNGPEEWESRIGQYYEGSLWERRDILPMKHYLIACIQASYHLGGEAWLQNFMKEGFIADGATSMEDYVRHRPDIQSEASLLPPLTSIFVESVLKANCVIFIA